MERLDLTAGLPSPEQFDAVTRTIKGLIGDISDDGVRMQCADAIRRGFGALFEIKQNHPEMAQQAQMAAYCMMLVSQCLTIDQKEKNHHPERTESRKHKPADGYAQTARQLAQSIAFSHWKNDRSQEMSLAAMSLYVWGKMIEMHYVEFLPDDYQELQHWISPVAPDYAKRQLRSVPSAHAPLPSSDAMLETSGFLTPLTRVAQG